MDKDFSVINQKIKDAVCTHPTCVNQFGGIEIMAKKIWVIEGQFIDEDSRQAAETEVLFHGCKDATLDLITENGGMDVNFCSQGAFGKGLYFSTQACKAFAYAQNHLLLCQVALGREEHRHTVTKPDRNLSFEEVCERMGKMSVQSHAGAPFNHEERIIYKSTQARVAYKVEMTQCSPCHGR